MSKRLEIEVDEVIERAILRRREFFNKLERECGVGVAEHEQYREDCSNILISLAIEVEDALCRL